MSEGALSSLCVHHEFMMHIRPCSLRIVHSCTLPSMHWEDEVRLLKPNSRHLMGWRSCDMNKLSPVHQSSPSVQSSNPVHNPVQLLLHKHPCTFEQHVCFTTNENCLTFCYCFDKVYLQFQDACQLNFKLACYDLVMT